MTGTNFPIGQANALYIGWTDTTSGNVTESDITWGPAGGPLTTVIIPRNGSDGGNSLALTNLVANSAYVFAVRDQDLLTETPFTDPPVTISTQATDIANILLEYGAMQWAVGSGQLTPTGTFSASVNIPACADARDVSAYGHTQRHRGPQHLHIGIGSVPNAH